MTGMLTCKSPVAVMRAAHALGAGLFDERSHKFSREDFTLPRQSGKGEVTLSGFRGKRPVVLIFASYT